MFKYQATRGDINGRQLAHEQKREATQSDFRTGIERPYKSRPDAEKRLQISDRQLKRIIARYKQLDDAGLMHKSRGKSSTQAYPATKKQQVISLYKEKYLGFGPTFASEKLLEDDELTVNAETLRLWLKEAGLWETHRKRKQHRSRRARRAQFGATQVVDYRCRHSDVHLC